MLDVALRRAANQAALCFGIRSGREKMKWGKRMKQKTSRRFRQDALNGGSDLTRTDDTPGMNRML